MIRVHRGPEPEQLKGIREAALAQLRPDGPAKRKDLPTGYQQVKGDLHAAQHQKCAYCESEEQSERNDVEHFRPAVEAKRSPGSAETRGYWWLAYTWENLLFACRNCNQAGAKGSLFPLSEGSGVLSPEQPPPGDEQPLLIDPGSESGVDDIEFFEDGVLGWSPRARNGSLRGDVSIKVLKLRRQGLLVRYRKHVEYLRPWIAPIERALDCNDVAALTAAWQSFVDQHLVPRALYAGLSRDVLASLVPEPDRTRLGLVLPDL